MRTNGAVLSGATFELMNGAGTVLATQTTGADGTARFDNLPAGGYTVREVGAPTGYKIAVNPSQTGDGCGGRDERRSF